MSISTNWRSLLLVENSKNKFACELLDELIQDEMYRVIGEIIFYKNRIYLIPDSTLKKNIVQESHGSPLSGHQGFLKTYRQIRDRFSWKGLKKDVIQHVWECIICQQNKIEHTHPAGLLQPLAIPKQ